jgi:hypothetical protein
MAQQLPPLERSKEEVAPWAQKLQEHRSRAHTTERDLGSRFVSFFFVFFFAVTD